MYELLFAFKYLIPRKKSLSTSIISLLSVFVIALVVWLVVVFLSVTTGIESKWIGKLTSLHAPIQIVPTEEYYSSYYYQADKFSSFSNYSHKTIEEKILTQTSDPYNSQIDMPLPDFLSNGKVDIDPVKTVCQILDKTENISYQDFEVSGALMKITLKRFNPQSLSLFDREKVQHISQMIYLHSYSDKNPHLPHLLLPVFDEDILNLHNHPHDDLMKEENSWKERDFLLDTSEYFPVYLPKVMRDSNILIGDRGTLTYQAQTAMSAQEQQIPIFVAGFYDPGVLPIGNRCLLVPKQVPRQINATSPIIFDQTPTNGIQVWTKNLKEVKKVQSQLQKAFEEHKIASYWKISSYQEYDFAKDLMQQFHSDRLIFTLIAMIILLVACSNIISLLILLVNDKKKEIAVLRSMGASSKSISLIFGGCGAIMGFFSSLFGIGAAMFTLKHLDILIKALNALQGHAAFNVVFFGDKMPNDLSIDAISFVLIVTPIISIIAGIIPAIKASRLKPSATLRAE